MIELTNYKCEYCGFISMKKDDVKKCEEMHRMPIGVMHKQSYEYDRPAGPGFKNSYPKMIKVEFDNGDKISYTLDYNINR